MEEEKEREASLYPDLRPLQPSAPPAYPVVSNRGTDPKLSDLPRLVELGMSLTLN